MNGGIFDKIKRRYREEQQTIVFSKTSKRLSGALVTYDDDRVS